MKINKFNEQKLYSENSEFLSDTHKYLSKYPNCIDIRKRTIDLLNKLNIKFKLSTTHGYDDCSLNGEEFCFAYIATDIGKFYFLMETDDEWFYVKLTKGFKCDGYDGLTQLLNDW